MKITTDKDFVYLEAFSGYDIFYLGGLVSQLSKHGLNYTINLGDGQEPYAKLSVKKEDFVTYLIKNLENLKHL